MNGSNTDFHPGEEGLYLVCSRKVAFEEKIKLDDLKLHTGEQLSIHVTTFRYRTASNRSGRL